LIVATRGRASIRPGAARWNQSTALSLLISVGIITLGAWVVAATIVKSWPFAWALLALFPLKTGFISLSGSIKATED
jgi:hypothetical protein